MDRIARETEPELPYGDWVFNRAGSDDTDVASSVARAAVGATYTLGLAAIVVPTRSGRTARLVSAHRPRTPVLAISPRLETVRRLNLLFGVQCAIAEDWTGLTALLEDCARLREVDRRREVRRPDRDHRRASPAGAGDEPVRDPPRPLISTDRANIARLAAPLALMALIFYLSARTERRAPSCPTSPASSPTSASTRCSPRSGPGRSSRISGGGRSGRRPRSPCSTRSATSSTSATCPAATPTPWTSWSTGAGSRSASGSAAAFERLDQRPIGVRHPADRLGSW